MLFDNVEPNPSLETAEKVISNFQNSDFSHIVGIGGGSSMDVAKYCAFKMNKPKIMIPTTFGSGSEVTRISVLKVDNKKKSFHDDGIIADIALVDSHFIEKSSNEIIRNAVIDACAQCTEAYDSKLAKNYEKIVMGSLLDGLGFGNSSTTLGHALSYVYSNEGISHGHALAFTTSVAHKFNDSKFYERFHNLVMKLDFPKISLHQSLENAAETIIPDKKHLDNNPKSVTKEDIIKLLESINTQNY